MKKERFWAYIRQKDARTLQNNTICQVKLEIDHFIEFLEVP